MARWQGSLLRFSTLATLWLVPLMARPSHGQPTVMPPGPALHRSTAAHNDANVRVASARQHPIVAGLTLTRQDRASARHTPLSWLLPRQQYLSALTPMVTPITSGTITLSDWTFPYGCNPLVQSFLVDLELCAGTWDNLFLLDNTLHSQPDLSATMPTLQNGGVQIVNGNMLVTYTLKPHLAWSDGSPLTMDDFAFSYNVETAMGNQLDPVLAMTQTTPTTVTVLYSGIHADYLSNGVPTLLPRSYLEAKYGTTDIPTIAATLLNDSYNSPTDVFCGPYMIGSWNPNQPNTSVTLLPNPYYNALPSAPGHPRPAQIQFVSISNNANALAEDLAYGSTNADIGEGLQLDNLSVLQSTSAFAPVVAPTIRMEHLELNLNGVLGDPVVRQALQLAIDKNALLQTAYEGFTTTAPLLLNSVIPGVSPWNDAAIGPSTYDPAKARAMLAAAGYATSTDPSAPGRHLTIWLATTTSLRRQDEAVLLQSEWNAIGIGVNMNFSEDDGAPYSLFASYANNGILAHRAFDVALFSVLPTADPASEETYFNPALIPTAATHDGNYQNYTGITDTVQWNLLQQADQTLDPVQRAVLIDQWQQAVQADLPWIMLYAWPSVSATDGTVGNYLPNPAIGWTSNEWNMYEWYKMSGTATPTQTALPSPTQMATDTATPGAAGTTTPQPSVSATAVPPSLTATTIAPTATDTPTIPTATATPTASDTATTALPTATATRASSPPTTQPPQPPATTTSGSPPPPTPTSSPRLAATPTLVPPVPAPATSTAVGRPIGVGSGGPPTPTATATAPYSKQAHHAPLPHRYRLRLTLTVTPGRVRSGAWLTVRAHTAARTPLMVRLQITRRITIWVGRGHRRHRQTRKVILYSLVVARQTGPRGNAVWRIRVSYVPHRPGGALVIVTVPGPRRSVVAQAQAPITVLPPTPRRAPKRHARKGHS